MTTIKTWTCEWCGTAHHDPDSYAACTQLHKPPYIDMEPEELHAEIQRLTAERNALCIKLSQQQEMVEKCMIEINRNADLGQASEKECDSLRADSERMNVALKEIEEWASHSRTYSINFGSNGVRDFYRAIAKVARTAS